MRGLSVGVALICVMTSVEAAGEVGAGVPDLTKGGELKRINKRWVGPVGIFCGAWRPDNRRYSEQLKYVRQLLVLEVDKGSPADGILAKDDVILGADGTGAAKVPLFEGGQWAMIPIADAITEAEARNPALLKLLIWRPIDKTQGGSTDGDQSAGKPPTLDDFDLNDSDDGRGNALDDRGPSPKKKTFEGKVEGKTETVTIKLETLGRYSDTAPYNCEKSKRVLRKGIKALYESNKPDKAGFGMLCLLAADDPTNPSNDKYQARAKEWAHKLEDGGSPWFSGPKLIALSEYYMKTKDETIFPKLVKQAEHHARGVSWFGTTGHKWADKQPDGSINGPMSGYGPIGASGALGFLGLSLARKAGVKSPVVDAANKAQRIFFGHYAFKGAPSYGEFFYGITGGTDDNNGKCAMTALALGLEEGREEKAKYFSRIATLTTYNRRVYAHGGSFFGMMWHPIGAAQGGVKTANLRFKEIRWHLDLKRRWNHTRIYDASGNNYGSFCWDATALLFYAMPLKQLYITGRGRKESLKLTDAEFRDVLATKAFDAGKATPKELIAALSRFQGMRRGSAGGELANRIKAKPDDPESAALIDQLLELAADSKASPAGRTGACHALRTVKHKVGEPLASLRNAEIAKTGVAMLIDPDAYVRFGAMRLLEKLNPEAVRPYVNEILDAVIATGRPTFPLDEEDPLQAAHSVMGDLLFGKLLSKSLDGVDRKKLIPAIRSMLETPNSLGRNSASRVLDKLSKEEVLELADVIVHNARYRAPANAMAGTAYLNASRKVLAKHLFEEGLPLSLIYGGGSAVKDKIPQKYGRAGFTMASSRRLMQSLGDMMLAGAQVDANAVVELMQKGPEPENMSRLKTIHSIKAAQSTLQLPAAATEFVADARNYAFPNVDDTTYTWRKVYGAGKVAFAPNASGKSKTTTVAFTDRKPGRYRFEVTMSDILGYTEVRKTIDVTLYDRRGRLPANRPPRAKSLTLETASGLPTKVVLSGSDPDGDELGYRVTRGPSGGRLSGVGGDLTYTAKFGFNGTDSFTFEAIDGQGKTATGTVEFKVSDKNVGVAVYEGFDYPTGSLHERGEETSFGFGGLWVNSRKSDNYRVEREHGNGSSLSYPSLPSTGGRLSKGQRHTRCSRGLDRQLLSNLKMLDPGGQMWFSFFISDGVRRSLTFHGPNTSFGVEIKGSKDTGVHATLNGEEGSSRNSWSRSSGLRFARSPHMIVGRCVWGRTDKDPDTVEVFRVFDAPGYGIVLLENPVSVVKGVIPQETVNSMGLFLMDKAPFDEIRVGPTLHSVMLGTKPLDRKPE